MGAVAVRLRQPVLIAYIVVGIAVGPAGLELVKSHDQIDLLAQIGVAVLLFLVGLKLDLQHVRHIGPVALATGLGQLAFTIAIGFVLVSGPEGMTLDPETGLIEWTPGPNALPETPVVVRAYDDAGGFGEETWTITIAEGLNAAPELEAPNALIELVEGEEFRLPILAFDPDFDLLLLFADNLPQGAYLDQETQELVWVPQAGQRGLYQGVTIGASDGGADITPLN